jgi:hypothetical protein
VAYRGHFGEPYCSIGCELMGGTDAIQALVDGRRGKCQICGMAVQGSASEDRCTIAPFDGSLIFYCLDCRDRGQAFVATADSCAKCGAALS